MENSKFGKGNCSTAKLNNRYYHILSRTTEGILVKDHENNIQSTIPFDADLTPVIETFILEMEEDEGDGCRYIKTPFFLDVMNIMDLF